MCCELGTRFSRARAEGKVGERNESFAAEAHRQGLLLARADESNR